MIARRAIVEVRAGPSAPRKAVIEPGQTLRVGRSNMVELPIPQDAKMSAEHLALFWDGARCRVRDLGSAHGTRLQGEAVRDAEVQSGAWIQAGETSLMVYFERHSRPGRGAPAPVDETVEALAELRRIERLYAVVDASRGARPLALLRESVDEHGSLYDGTQGAALADAAPYLVAIRPDSTLLDQLVLEGWGARWGIYLSCPRPFKDVRRHLRRFLMVEDDENGQIYYFRFYDPWTLNIFLPTCTPRQRQDFFGDVTSFLAEGRHGELVRFPREAP